MEDELSSSETPTIKQQIQHLNFQVNHPMGRLYSDQTQNPPYWKRYGVLQLDGYHKDQRDHQLAHQRLNRQRLLQSLEYEKLLQAHHQLSLHAKILLDSNQTLAQQNQQLAKENQTLNQQNQQLDKENQQIHQLEQQIQQLEAKAERLSGDLMADFYSIPI